MKNEIKNKKRERFTDFKKHKTYYFMLIPMVIFFILFCYLPMPGLYYAFVNYDFMKGLAGGIEKSRGMIKSAVSNVAKDMTITPMLNGIVNPQSMIVDSLINANVISGRNADSNASLGAKLDAMTSLMSRYLPRMAESQVVLDSGALVGELSDGLNRQLGKAYL